MIVLQQVMYFLNPEPIIYLKTYVVLQQRELNKSNITFKKRSKLLLLEEKKSI